MSSFGAIVHDHFLASVLLMGPIREAGLEHQLTTMRRQALAADAPLETLAHLAIQCFLNEYAWHAEPDESARVAELQGRTDPRSLLRIACYQRLTKEADGPTSLQAVLQMQVREVEAQRKFAADVPVLTGIAGGTSQAVRAMYEENPYPRWSTVGATMPAPAAPFRDILIVGCGTGKHSIHAALRYPNARIVAVDLSRASLGYAILKTGQTGVTNIEYAQADLMNLGDLGERFDLVESIGTLTCVDDPAAGLAILADLTKPGGRLKIGLYSELAREPLKPSMNLGREYPSTPEGIRAFRHRIMTAEPGDPVRAALEFVDFYSTSMCRDLLLHVKEHRHTAEQVATLLSNAGLTFDGFELHETIKAKFRAEFDDELDLLKWARFEQRHPRTFRNMYQIQAHKPA